MISFVWDKRAFPVYFELLPKLGASNIHEQKAIMSKVLSRASQINGEPCFGGSVVQQEFSVLTVRRLFQPWYLPLFKNYKTCVLGDREFCSVHLANWLKEWNVYFCLRLNSTHFVSMQTDIWLQLKDLGLSPGVSFFIQGVKVTKTQGFFSFNVACKWQRPSLGVAPEEGWFILTNLETLQTAIAAYKKRFDIEEMFRDFKSGGYNERGY